MELKLDWEKGTSSVARVLFRPGPRDLQLPGGHDAGQPETPLYFRGKRYFTNGYNSNPTNPFGQVPVAMGSGWSQFKFLL